MGKLQEKANEYHEQFAARIIAALKEGTAPWQKPCPPYRKVRSGPVPSSIVRKRLNNRCLSTASQS